MVSLASICASAHGQYTQVVQCLGPDTYPANGDALAADIAYGSIFQLGTTGTELLSDGRTRIVTRWPRVDWPPSGCDPNDPIYNWATREWDLEEPGQSVAHRIVASQQGGGNWPGKPFYWVGGKQIHDDDEDAKWEALILTYRHETYGNPSWPAEQHIFTYGSSVRNHEVIAMDAVPITQEYGPLCAAIIRADGGTMLHGPVSIVVVLRPVWTDHPTLGWIYELEEIVSYPLAWFASDVRIEYRHDTTERIRVWVVGNSPPAFADKVRILQLDLSDPQAINDSLYDKQLTDYNLRIDRFVLDTWNVSGDRDLFIVGSAGSTQAQSKWQTLLLRFGPDGQGDWEFRWHEMRASDGDAFGNDIGVARGVDGQNTNDYIFIAATAEREISQGVYTNDFTVLCYRQEQNLGTVSLRWEARFQPQNGDDRALRLLATDENSTAVAVVAGVVENQSNEWDWQFVKYGHQNSTPLWNINFPLQSSDGDDIPAAMSAPKHAFPSHLRWNLEEFWAAGGSYSSTTGHNMTTVKYKQSNP
jgi:hypothetical protein